MLTAQFRNRSADVIEHGSNIVNAETINSPLLDVAKSHEMLAEFREYFRILAAADALVTFQDTFADTRFEHLDIADDTESRHFGRQVVELAAPIRMPGFAQRRAPRPRSVLT